MSTTIYVPVYTFICTYIIYIIDNQMFKEELDKIFSRKFISH